MKSKYGSILLLILGLLNAILAGVEAGRDSRLICFAASALSVSLLTLSFSLRVREVVQEEA